MLYRFDAKLSRALREGSATRPARPVTSGQPLGDQALPHKEKPQQSGKLIGTIISGDQNVLRCGRRSGPVYGPRPRCVGRATGTDGTMLRGRTFWVFSCDRYVAEGADGSDRCLGRLARWPGLELFDTRYDDFTAKHFHEKPLADHGFTPSYNWPAELASPWAPRGAQAWGAGVDGRAVARHDVAPGRLEPRVGPRSMVGPDRHHGRCDQRYLLGLLVAEEGTMSSFQGVSEAIWAKGLFCSLYADRASHYWNTPEAGGKVDKDTPTQVGRALAQLGIELIPAYSPEARGRSERMFGTLQKRLPQELRLAGITDMVEANRFLKEVFLPQHNARFATPAEDRGTAFVPFTGALDDILCIHEERTVSNDNTVRYKRLALQIPAGRHRRHYVKARVRVHEYPDGTMAVFHGPRCLARYHADGQPIDSQTREAA